MKKLLQAVLLVVFVLGTVMQPGFANVVLDSDADGLSDTDEINIYGTDPNNPDTDGDGIDDYAEINFDDGSELNDDLRIAVNSSYALSGDAGSGWVENALNPIMTGT